MENSPKANVVRRAAGLHLSGLSAKRSCLVVLAVKQGYIEIESIVDKIGSMGPVSSDDRLIQLLANIDGLSEVFVDCPLSLPPCVACPRPACPGVERCEDTSVAYMQALNAQTVFVGARKRRPINPQIQRVWDVAHIKRHHGARLEPSFSSNQAHLVVRAVTLQKRVNHSLPHLRLLETVPGFALAFLQQQLGVKQDWTEFRSFGQGAKIREGILQDLDGLPVAGSPLRISRADYLELTKSPAGFSAMVCALVGAFYLFDATNKTPENYALENGWIYLPENGPVPADPS